MKITFLGTGSAWPIPRIGCTCPQCASRDPRDLRGRSAAIVEAAPGGPQVLIDAGADIYRQLAPLGREGVARIEALVVTHVHPDHFLGLVDLAAALAGPIPLWHLGDNLAAIEACFGYLLPDGPARGGGRRTAPHMFTPRLMKFGEPFLAAGLELTPFDTHHFREFSTAGIIAAAGGKRAAYAPDFKRTEPENLAALDLLVIDGSMIEGRRAREFGHSSIGDGIDLAQRVKPRRTVFTHIGHVKTPHAEIEALVQGASGQFDVAYDGWSVEI